MPPTGSGTSHPRRILVDHAGNKGIGDIVCELDYYRALSLRYPQAQLVSRGSRTLAWGNPWVHAFDETSPDSDFDRIIRQTSLAPIAERLESALDTGETIFRLFLEHQGLEASSAPPELFVLPQEFEEVGIDPGDRLLVVYSADSKEPDRRWGGDRFQALARYLEEVHGAMLVEIGSGLTEGHLGVGLDLVGKTDLRRAMAVIARADLFVGNNGGLTHLAGGVGTPVLVPWGASSPYEPYAYDGLSLAVVTDPPCRNCGWTGLFLPSCMEVSREWGRTPCTQDITVEDMQGAVDEWLPTVREQRATLRAAKQARIRRARDPRELGRFEQARGLVPYAYPQLAMGGPVGWPTLEISERLAGLRRIVAFPDWSRPAAWQELIGAYVRECTPEDPWVLVLTADPLTGPQVQEVLGRFLADHAAPPRILVVIGALSLREREGLVAEAAASIANEDAPHATFERLIGGAR